MKGILIIFEEPASGIEGCGVIVLAIVGIIVLFICGTMVDFVANTVQDIKLALDPPAPVQVLVDGANPQWIDNDTIQFTRSMKECLDKDSTKEIRATWDHFCYDWDGNGYMPFETYHISAHGGIPTKIARGLADVDSPIMEGLGQCRGVSAVSPDGKTIAYGRNHDLKQHISCEVRLKNSEGSHDHFLTYADCSQMAWSPDSKNLACSGWNLASGVNVLTNHRYNYSYQGTISIIWNVNGQ